MVKGISVKFKSYGETIPAVLKVIKLNEELRKHNKIIIKPSLSTSSKSTPVELTEAILKYCIANKNPVAEIFIAEGADGEDTDELFDVYRYKQLAEKYSVGLIDLNNSEVEEMLNGDFLKFDRIHFPSILRDSFVISTVQLGENEETEINGSLSNMLGVFPSSHYKGLFSRNKSKIRKWPIKYSIHDALVCKMPNLAIIDASEKGLILAGQPLEMDKQAAILLGKDAKSIHHLRLVEESFFTPKKSDSKERII